MAQYDNELMHNVTETIKNNVIKYIFIIEHTGVLKEQISKTY